MSEMDELLVDVDALTRKASEPQWLELRHVELTGLPVDLTFAVDAYLSEIVREVHVIRMDPRPQRHSAGGAALLGTVDTLLELFGDQQLAVRALAERAHDHGDDCFDVAMDLPLLAADGARLMILVFQKVQQLSSDFRLLNPPADKEAFEFFLWFLEQMEGQISGRFPMGASYERGGFFSETSFANSASVGAELRAHREFPCDLNSAPDARRFVAGMLSSWGLNPADVQRVQLPVAELMSNALLHGQGTVTVHVSANGRRIRVEVQEDGPGKPRMRRRNKVDDSGRGLLLVEALSDHWGYEPLSSGGKRVWFELTTDI